MTNVKSSDCAPCLFWDGSTSHIQTRALLFYNVPCCHSASLMYWFSRAAVTKYHKSSGLKKQKLILLQFWRQESKIKKSARLVPSEDCEENSVPCPSPSFWECWQILAFLGLKIHHWNLCLLCHMVSCLFFCVFTRPSCDKNTSLIGLGAYPTPVWLHLTNYVCNNLISK